jgi:hypothetical protein
LRPIRKIGNLYPFSSLFKGNVGKKYPGTC